MIPTNLITFTVLAAVCAVWILGLHAVTRRDKILGFVDMTAKKGFINHVTKPMFDCPTCMSSVHGCLFYLIGLDGSIWLLPIFCITVAGLVDVFAGMAGWNRGEE